MKYEYIEKQVEGAKALAEEYPYMQVHQDIYREYVEVLRKAKAFDEVLDVSSWNAMDLGDAVHGIVREFEEDTINE